MSSIKKCLIWGDSLGFVTREKFLWMEENKYTPYYQIISDDGQKYEYCNPQAGGKYIIPNTWTSISPLDFKPQDRDTDIPRNLTNNEKVRLSGYIAQENLKGNTPDLDKLMKDDNWLEKLPPIPDQDSRENLLLKGLINLFPNIGYPISLQNVDVQMEDNPTPWLYALSYCSTESEFHELLESLQESKDIKITRNYAGSQCDLKVTKAGRKRIEKINNKTPNTNSTTAFIAMWMDSSMNYVKESIKTAIKNAGYKPVRIDDIKNDDKIDNTILSLIEKSKFIVCDITAEDKDKPRASVFFEAGYAKGKNIPVIWSCNKTMREMQTNVFDTRQYYCGFWDTNCMSKFEKELQEQIEGNENIGKGPLKGSLE